MLRSPAATPPCWNWGPVRSALSLWQGTTMPWGHQEAQEDRGVQGAAWAWERSVAAAPPGTTSSTHPQRSVRAGRSIAQDWLVDQACFTGPAPTWSLIACPPAMTPSTSHTHLAMLHLYVKTASAYLWTWARLSKVEGECWGWMETWQSVPMWSRDVEAAWSSRGTLSKPTRRTRYRAHHRHAARSGSEYETDINTEHCLSLTH